MRGGRLSAMEPGLSRIKGRLLSCSFCSPTSFAAAPHRDAQVAQQALLLVVLDALLPQLILCTGTRQGR